MARCAGPRSAAPLPRGKPPPNTIPADSGSTTTCRQKYWRTSSSTAVLPAPGPPVSTIRLRTCCWLQAHSRIGGAHEHRHIIPIPFHLARPLQLLAPMLIRATPETRAAAERAGALAAACTLIGALASGPLALLVVHATHPQPDWQDARVFAEHYHPIQTL